MKVLLVDNDTHYKKKLQKLLEEMDVVSVPYQEVGPELLDLDFDLIVLSGSQGKSSVKYHAEELWGKELELIRASKTPVVGICLGAQLIAYAFGTRLSVVPGGKKLKGIKKHVYNVKKNPFSFSPRGASVFTSQRWRITELPDELEAWCASAEGIEVFKHKDKPLYGLQFHPERRAENNDGARIFFTIVKKETGFTSKLLTMPAPH